jgi:hypothetical protein
VRARGAAASAGSRAALPRTVAGTGAHLQALLDLFLPIKVGHRVFNRALHVGAHGVRVCVPRAHHARGLRGGRRVEDTDEQALEDVGEEDGRAHEGHVVVRVREAVLGVVHAVAVVDGERLGVVRAVELLERAQRRARAREGRPEGRDGRALARERGRERAAARERQPQEELLRARKDGAAVRLPARLRHARRRVVVEPDAVAEDAPEVIKHARVACAREGVLCVERAGVAARAAAATATATAHALV